METRKLAYNLHAFSWLLLPKGEVLNSQCIQREIAKSETQEGDQSASQLRRRTAAYPDEIADRLIKMFSVKGDTGLDPFLGSGTTAKAAIQNERNSVGYETDQNLLSILTKKTGNNDNKDIDVRIIKR